MLRARRGGLLASTFSCALLAVLAVGRVMRDKKLSSALTGFDALSREDDGLAAVEFDRARVLLVPAVADKDPLVDARIEWRPEGFEGAAAAGFADLDASSCLAAEDAVGAVRRDDNSATRVGNL